MALTFRNFLQRFRATLCLGPRGHNVNQLNWTTSGKMQFGTDINNEKGLAVVRVPGLGCNDFTSTSKGDYNFRTWKISDHVDNARERAFNDGYLEYKKLEETHFTYVSATTLKRLIPLKALFNLTDRPYKFEFNVTCELSCMGTSSFQLNHDVIANIDGQPKNIFSSSIVYVCVDRETRKTTPPPIWWTDKYKAKCTSKDMKPFKLDPVTLIAEETYHQPVLVGALDIDYYGHANNTSYTRFAMDSVYSAIRAKACKAHLSEDFLSFQIRKMESLFLQDCTVGDILLGKVMATGDKIFCVIKKKDDDLFHQTIHIDESDLQ